MKHLVRVILYTTALLASLTSGCADPDEFDEDSLYEDVDEVRAASRISAAITTNKKTYSRNSGDNATLGDVYDKPETIKAVTVEANLYDETCHLEVGKSTTSRTKTFTVQVKKGKKQTIDVPDDRFNEYKLTC